MRPHWTGVFPACTTQLKRDQSLDLPATARHLEALIESGISGLVMCGSLGENQTLDSDEKRAVVQCAIETAGGRVPVLSGVAEASTAAANGFARFFSDYYGRLPVALGGEFPCAYFHNHLSGNKHLESAT